MYKPTVCLTLQSTVGVEHWPEGYWRESHSRVLAPDSYCFRSHKSP